MNKGLIKDIEKQFLDAVKCYEEEIANINNHDINSFINLAFLYWSFATEQIEFNDPNNIPIELAIIGEERFLPIIDKGLELWPENTELLFWRHYFPYRLYMTDFSEDECKKILQNQSDKVSLVPYFFLYLFDKTAYGDEIEGLRKICANEPTAKNLYIRTFIE